MWLRFLCNLFHKGTQGMAALSSDRQWMMPALLVIPAFVVAVIFSCSTGVNLQLSSVEFALAC